MRHPDDLDLSGEHGTVRDHVAEYARNHGALRPEAAWILSPFDTWEANPFFVGPRPPHPESLVEEWSEEELDIHRRKQSTL